MTSEPPKKQSQLSLRYIPILIDGWLSIMSYIIIDPPFGTPKNHIIDLSLSVKHKPRLLMVLDAFADMADQGNQYNAEQELGTHCCAMLWSESAVSIRAACHALCPGQKGSAQRA